METAAAQPRPPHPVGTGTSPSLLTECLGRRLGYSQVGELKGFCAFQASSRPPSPSCCGATALPSLTPPTAYFSRYRLEQLERRWPKPPAPLVASR